MDNSLKTREELIRELEELRHSNNDLREQYENNIALLKVAHTNASKSEEKFQKAYMISPDSVNINRLSDGMFISINEGFTEILGYTEEDAIGKTSVELNIWADIESRNSLVKELKKKGRVANFEAVFKRKDGNIVYGLMSASLIDLDGIPHILNVTKDISIRKKIEKELTHEQYLMNAIMNNFPDHIYFKDCENKFIRINKSLSDFFGLNDPLEAVGKTDFDFFTNEHAKQAYEDEKNIILTGQTLTIEEKETNPDGSDTWVSTVKLPLRDDGGNIIGTFGISKDITDEHSLENDILFKQLLLEAIIENIPDQIYYKDRNSKFVLCNTPVALLAGCNSEKDLLGKSDFDFYPHHLAQQYFNDEQAIMEKGDKLLDHEEQVINKKTGELHWNLSSKVPVRDAGGKVIGLAGINRDITSRKMAEEEINLKNEQLVVANSEKDKFFSIIAHDLKGPLSAFLDATQILTEEIHNMSLKEIKDISSQMKESASGIYGLLVNLLEWSRLKRGMMSFNPELINLKKSIAGSIEVLKESADKKAIRITSSLPDNLEINADLHMFGTVVRNLVSNAIKFTPRSGAINIAAKAIEDNVVEIKVSDTGIGIPKAMISKLFLLNEKTNRNGTEDEPSTGLGLLLCKEFVEKLGGKIWVNSEEGKGAMFSFTLSSFKP